MPQKYLRIGLNLLNAKTGAGLSVSEAFLRNLPDDPGIKHYVIFISTVNPIYNECNSSKILFVKVRTCPQNPFLRILWEQFVMPFYLFYWKVDILYSIGNVSIILAPCKVLLFFENSNPFSDHITGWSSFQKLRLKLLYWLGAISALKASRIRFCSLRSRDLILERYKFIKPQKTFVLPHGLDFALMRELGHIKKKRYDPFILCVAAVAPHKNLGVLLKAFRILQSEGTFDGKLIIVGNTKCYPNYYKSLLNLVEQFRLHDSIVFAGEIPYKEVFYYYAQAKCFVLPSLEETFGIPLIEAMYFNVPSVVPDQKMYPDHFIPFNEIAGELAIYFDPYSAEDLASKIRLALSMGTIDSRPFVERNYDIKKLVKLLVEEFEKI